MDLTAVMVEMGFLEGGTPKGFRIGNNRLTLWVRGQPERRARAELESLYQRIAKTYDVTVVSSDRSTAGNGLTTAAPTIQLVLSMASVSQPDIWVVAENPDQAEAERQRWVNRGYRVAVVDTVSPDAPGLVVSMAGDAPNYDGRLPRKPVADQMVQSWH